MVLSLCKIFAFFKPVPSVFIFSCQEPQAVSCPMSTTDWCEDKEGLVENHCAVEYCTSLLFSLGNPASDPRHSHNILTGKCLPWNTTENQEGVALGFFSFLIAGNFELLGDPLIFWNFFWYAHDIITKCLLPFDNKAMI